MTAHSLIKALLRPRDDLVLKSPAEIPEMVTVAGNPDDEIPVVFRMLLSLQKRLAVNDIELNVVAVQVEIGAHQACHVVEPLLPGHIGRSEFLVQQSSPLC